MSDPASLARRNSFLSGLPAADLDRLRPSLKPVELPLKHMLHPAGKPIEHIYFLAAGMASVVLLLDNGLQIEVGVIGKESAVGIGGVMGESVARHETFMQIRGDGLRLPVQVLRDEVRRSPATLDAVLRSTQALLSQVSQNAACNAHHHLEERLARWLLMARERNDSDVLPLTHEFLSMMLGVRRSGVTVTVGALEKAGIIENHRGRITLRDRERLELVACECYRLIKSDTDRLLGV